MYEDAGLDGWLEGAYDERYEYEPYWDDAEEFERNQLALDRDAEYEYDEDIEGDDPPEYEPDEPELWDESTAIFTPDGLEPPF